MMLTQQDLLAVLEACEPWHWKATDWRKLSNGRIVRIVNWGWKSGKTLSPCLMGGMGLNNNAKTKGKSMSMNEETHATDDAGRTTIHLRTGCNIKSPALRRTMHRLVGNITAGVAQVVAQEVGSFLEAIEEAFSEATAGGASHE